MTQVWYKMMVDYWESRYYIEQTHGLREAQRKKIEEEARMRQEAAERQRLEEIARREKLRRMHVTGAAPRDVEEAENDSV